MFATVTDVKRLQAAFSKTITAINKSDSSPIESYLHVAAGDGELTISAVDSTSHQLSLTVPADVTVPGFTLIKADLAKRYNALGSKPVNVQLTENGRMLRVEQEFDIHDTPTFAGDKGLFPLQSELPELKAIIEPAQLKQFLTRVKAIKEDPAQRLDLDLGEELLTGYTNSPGLFFRQTNPLTQGFSTLQCSVGINTLAKMPDFTTAISIRHDEGLLVFASDEGTFWVRCQDTPSPVRAIDQLFDRDRSGYWIVKSNQLLTKLGGILAGRTSVPTRLNPATLEGRMNLQTVNAVEGLSHVVLGLEDASEGLQGLCLNAASLKTALACLKSDLAMGEHVEHLGRTLLRLINENDGSSPKILLLPVNPGE